MIIKREPFDRLKACLADGTLELYLEHTRALVAVLDGQGAPQGWNPAFQQLRDADPEAQTLQDFLSTAARLEFLGTMRDVLQGGNPVKVQLEMATRAGRARYDCLLAGQADDQLLFVGEPVMQGSDKPEIADGEVDVPKLMAELKDTRDALEAKKKELQAVLTQADEVSHTDALTLLPNRRWIIADLQEQVNMSQRYGLPLTVSLIDLDHFKQINDTFGHAAGDQVLRYVASEMRDHIRQPDKIGRYGGDEFLVILPNTSEKAAAEQAHRLCEHMRGDRIIIGKDTAVPMSLSIGVAQYRPGTDDWRTLLERADQALYRAKNDGRGRWAIEEV